MVSYGWNVTGANRNRLPRVGMARCGNVNSPLAADYLPSPSRLVDIPENLVVSKGYQA
jgi:hypothetical protein